MGKLLLSPKWTKTARNDPTRVFLHYNSDFFRTGLLVFLYTLHEVGTINTQNWQSQFFFRNSFFKRGPKRPKMVWFISFPILAAFFLRTGSLDLSHILHEVDGPYVITTGGAKFIEKILACLNMGQNDPKSWNDPGPSGGGERSLQCPEWPGCMFNFGLFFQTNPLIKKMWHV